MHQVGRPKREQGNSFLLFSFLSERMLYVHTRDKKRKVDHRATCLCRFPDARKGSLKEEKAPPGGRGEGRQMAAHKNRITKRRRA